jgi:GMP synthase-like glutamine amidotransferase
MDKKLLIVQNITHEGPGILQEVLDEHSLASDTCDLSKSGIIPDPRNYDAVIVLGGPQSANDCSISMLHELQRIRETLNAGIPYLGICLGLQTMVKAAGGSVVRSPVKEVGFHGPDGNEYTVELTPAGSVDPIFEGLGRSFRVFQLHGETVQLAEGMELLASGKHCTNQIVRAGVNAYGLQCHFEMTPAMFEAWSGIDADLKAMDRESLIGHFNGIRDEYHATGKQLMENFLHIAQLA